MAKKTTNIKNIFYLSIKKLREDLPRSIVLICCIVLLSTLIMVLGNICQYIHINFEDILLSTANEEGLDFNISISKDGNINDDIESHINSIESVSKNFAYGSESHYSDMNIDDKKCDVYPYFSFGMLEDFNIIKGENISENANGKNYIWLSQAFAEYDIGDIATLNINGKKIEFVVKGIIEGSSSFIDYRYLDIRNLQALDMSDYDDFAIIKKLNNLYKDLEKFYNITKYNTDYSVDSSIIYLYDVSNIYYSSAVALCVFIISVTLALTVLGLINAVKISTDNNQQFFATLKSLGIKEKGIMLYNMFLWIFYIFLGVIIAMIIASVILHFLLENILASFFKLLYFVGLDFITGFCWWIPFVCIILMFVLCMIVAKSESKRLAKMDIAEMIKGDS